MDFHVRLSVGDCITDEYGDEWKIQKTRPITIFKAHNVQHGDFERLVDISELDVYLTREEEK